MSHDVGDAVRLWAVFRDEAGAQADPGLVTLAVRHPDYTVEDIPTEPAEAGDETLAEEAMGETLTGVTGVYKAVVEPDAGGVWWYRWAGEGAVMEAEESWFAVNFRRVSAES